MYLLPGWYVIADSDELRQGVPLSITRFGRELVLWRDTSGDPVAMNDRCPHRSAKLSEGEIESDSIVCPFHGFKYSRIGQCSHVPETGQSASNLKVNCFPAMERHDFIWILYGSDSSLDIPWFDELDKEYGHSQIIETWPCHFTRCVENQLDYAHLPIVHKTTIGRFSFDPKIKVDFELTNKSIKFSPTGKAFIEFLFPNLWRNYISEDFQLVLAFAPVSETETKLYLRSYFRKLNIPVVRNIVGAVFNITNSIILNQDRRVVISQSPQNIEDESIDENLFPSDRAIKHFRKIFTQSRTEK